MYFLTIKKMVTQKNNQKIRTNQTTTVTIPKPDYISIDRRIWNSIKRRIEISDRIFDIKDFVLILIGAVLGGWVSYFSIDSTKQSEYWKWLILFTFSSLIALIILFWFKKQKKEFTDTVIADMNEIEWEC